ncbi:HAMP domain-containing histidine kinase [Leuconostoc carnosum]|nr:HAMP domain-containing histidine kinase [Leuconostoc carnosum]KAA8382538.1 HAMP domain-containing histidine kinase [Leuconostoc carnosum]
MIKRFFSLLWQFFCDFWYLYITIICIYCSLFWSTFMRSLNINSVLDTLWNGLYILAIISIFLFWRWYKANDILENLVTETVLQTLPNMTTLTSHEGLYQLLLQKQQLEQERIKSKLEENAQDIQDYYAMWAHQIKVPLSVLDLMNQTNTIDKYETSNQLLITNQYLDMMLHFIRLKSFHQDLSFEKINVQSLLRSVIQEYKYLFIHKDLDVSLSGFDLLIISDSKWLQFVFEQVIFNAIKYTSEGSIDIKCQNDHQVIIKDTGIGIAASDLPRLFDKGYTGFNGRLENNASGLGLYMVKQILHNLGHDIIISSKVNFGTSVIIDFKQTENR